MRAPEIPSTSIIGPIRRIRTQCGADPSASDFWVRAHREIGRREVGDPDSRPDHDPFLEHFLHRSDIPRRLWDVISHDPPLGIEIGTVMIDRAVKRNAGDIAAFLARDVSRATGMLGVLAGDPWLEFESSERAVRWLGGLGLHLSAFATPIDRWLVGERGFTVGATDVRQRGVSIDPVEWRSLRAGSIVIIELERYYDHLMAIVERTGNHEMRCVDVESGLRYDVTSTVCSYRVGLVPTSGSCDEFC